MSLEDALYPLLKVYDAAPLPLRVAAGRLYRSLPRRFSQGGDFAKFQDEARAVHEWDQERIQRYQTAALRESLLAAGQAPYYREAFAAAGVDPKAFESPEQLSAYPCLTKSDVIAQHGRMVNPRSPASRRLYITTGGSSGVPVGFYLEKGVGRPKELAFLEAQWSRRGYRPGDRVAVIRGGVTSSRAAGGISRYDATRDWLVLSSYHLTSDRLPEYVRALNKFRPRHLHLYPSAALALVRGLEESGLRLEFPIVSVLCGSERLTPESQRQIRQAFQAPVFHWYGHSERVVLAGQGAVSDHLYFWPNYGYVEFGPPDSMGMREVIGTSFHNRVMPLIRYRTGDFVRLPESPHGELPMPEVCEVAGREHEFLQSATGRRISLTAINMHDDIFDGLLAVQFFQPDPGRVECRCQPGPRWQSGRLVAIRAGLLRKLGDDFQLDVRLVERVEKTPAGKHRWLATQPLG